MWLPQKIYDSLPAAYATVGVLNILGALYVGVGDGMMLGHVIVGLACITGGVFVNGLRGRSRSILASTPLLD